MCDGRCDAHREDIDVAILVLHPDGQDHRGSIAGEVVCPNRAEGPEHGSVVVEEDSRDSAPNRKASRQILPGVDSLRLHLSCKHAKERTIYSHADQCTRSEHRQGLAGFLFCESEACERILQRDAPSVTVGELAARNYVCDSAEKSEQPEKEKFSHTLTHPA